MPIRALKTTKLKLKKTIALLYLLVPLILIPLILIPLIFISLIGLSAPASALDRAINPAPNHVLTPSPAPALDREIVIHEWLVTGPFLAAPGDGNIDFLGGERTLIPLPPHGPIPPPAQTFSSPLAEGGSVGWTKLSSDGPDVKILYNDIHWESAEAALGKAATLAVGYAWARFNVATPAAAANLDAPVNPAIPAVNRVRALVLVGGVSVFYLNGVLYEGEAVYGDINTIPVILREGENTVLLKFAGRKRAAFTFKFAPPAADLIITDDHTLPDVLENSPSIDAPAAFTLVNTTDRWMRDVVVRVTRRATANASATETASVKATETASVKATETASVSATETASVKARTASNVTATETSSATAGAATRITAPGGEISSSEKFSIAPLSALKIPLNIALKITPKIPLPAASDGSPAKSPSASKELRLRVEALSGNVPVSVKDVALAFKSPVDDVVRYTFISGIDGSVQYYALKYPAGYFNEKPYALIAALHGAGVEAEWMAAAYGAKDWAFVLAPVNRRPYGFDWQDFGRTDFYEALADVKSRFDIDARRIYLAGASMGGQGVWHIGLHDPSGFAALSPLAGWTSYYLYGPLFMQKSRLFAPPEMLSFRERALYDSDSLRFTQNARNIPVLVTQGDQDESVPPFHARMMKNALDAVGAHALYRELPGQGHWWEEPKSEGGGADCVDSPEIINFLRSKTLDEYPRDVTLSLYDLSINDRFYWIRVVEQERPFSLTRVSARVLPHGFKTTVIVESENAAVLQLNLVKELVGADTAHIVCNGKTRKIDLRGSRIVTLRNAAQGGDSAPGSLSRITALRKTAGLYGPLQAAFKKPFVIVYGTSGNAAETETLLHNARLLSMRFLRRANGLAPVVQDTGVSGKIIKNYNLVLIGSPERNLVTRKIMGRLPIKVDADGVTLAGRRLAGELSAALVYPNPLNPARLVAVFAGTTAAAEDFSLFFNPVSSGAGLPDFIVFDRSVKTKSWGGVRAAGFFSVSWGLKSNDYHIVNP
jgi:pimeloyl-ACP methyl ester carboxylesterase